ncbi:hypothetical protein ACFPRL_34530 [Pseudoclavibacter helvolus]
MTSAHPIRVPRASAETSSSASSTRSRGYPGPEGRAQRAGRSRLESALCQVHRSRLRPSASASGGVLILRK